MAIYGAKVEAKKLNAALVEAGKAVPRKSTLPVLACVELRASARTGKLLVTGTNLDAWVQGPVEVEAADNLAPFDPEHPVLVPLGRLAGATKGCKGAVTIEADPEKETVSIKRGDGSTVTVSTLPAEEFPHRPGSLVLTEESPVLDPTFRDALILAAGFVSTDTQRPALCGVFLQQDRIISTNGHYLIEQRGGWRNGKSGGFRDLLFPKDAAKLLPEGSVRYEVERCAGARWSEWQDADDPERTTFLRLLDGDYPKYRQVIPKEAPVTIAHVDVRAATETVRAAALVSDTLTHQVEVTLNGSFRVSASCPDRGSFDGEIAGAELSGVPMRAGYNGDYLARTLAAVADSAGRAMIEFRSPIKAAVFYPEARDERKGKRALLMPLRLAEGGK